MLVNTFKHIPGIGEKTESYLWRNHIYTWNSIVQIEKLELSKKYLQALRQYIPESIRALEAEDIGFFASKLRHNQLWRIFPDFRGKTAYLDIETTGLFIGYDTITTIAVYDGKEIYTYVRGENLHDFISDIQKYKMLITYNGKRFDIPFIESELQTTLPQVQLDLRYLLKSLGYTGGLKKCEERLGIHRNELRGVDGYFAVLLWKEYNKIRSKESLETLLAYNVADVLNLEKLMIIGYNKKIREYSELKISQIPISSGVPNPYKADVKLIDSLRKEIERRKQYFW